MAEITIVAMNQKGGKKLGSGSYGCVFQPPLLCRGDPPNKVFPPNRIGKFTELKDAEIEIAIAKYIKNAPGVENYLLLPDISSYCTPLPIEQQRERDIQGCEPLTDSRIPFSGFRQYEMIYGGKALKMVIPSNKTLYEIPRGFDFFTFMRQMLEIGSFLTLNGLVHNDLHSGNIILDRMFKPRLIDYGRAYAISLLDKPRLDMLMNVDFKASLGQISPEMSMADGARDGLSLEGMIQEFFNRNAVMKDGVERILGVPRSRQIAELRSFWKSSDAVKKGDWMTFYKLYWPLVDAWAVGSILLMRVLRKMMLFRAFTDSVTWKEKSANIRMILRGLLRASPRNRIDCVEALFLYDPMNSLVTSDTGRAWLDKRQSYREKRPGAAKQRGGGYDSDDDDPFYEED
jgi:serine/threonine protein kinase